MRTNRTAIILLGLATVLTVAVLLAVGCSQPVPPAPEPTLDIPGTVEAMIAELPTATPAPTYTPYPTLAARPTYTPLPTLEPLATLAPYPTPAALPTPKPQPTAEPWPTYTPYPTLEPVVVTQTWQHYKTSSGLGYAVFGTGKLGATESSGPWLLMLECNADDEPGLSLQYERSNMFSEVYETYIQEQLLLTVDGERSESSWWYYPSVEGHNDYFSARYPDVVLAQISEGSSLTVEIPSELESYVVAFDVRGLAEVLLSFDAICSPGS